MGRKHLSLIIVPHNKSGYRTLSFSRRVVKAAKWGSLALAVLLVALTADYIRIRVNGRTASGLAAENARQKEQLVQYQSAIGTLEKQIQALDEYRKKVNLIAGIKSSDDLKMIGPGGRSSELAEGQSLPGIPPAIQPSAIKGIQQKADDIQKNLESAFSVFQAKEAKISTTPTIYPTTGLLTSGFGVRLDPFTGKQAFHFGLDIAAAYGNPVVATADGIVIALNSDKMLGNWVQISHGMGIITIYGHLSKFLVKFVGQKVKRGDIIGEVGTTGKAVGPHVHYEVRVNGASVNPYLFILEE